MGGWPFATETNHLFPWDMSAAMPYWILKDPIVLNYFSKKSTKQSLPTPQACCLNRWCWSLTFSNCHFGKLSFYEKLRRIRFFRETAVRQNGNLPTSCLILIFSNVFWKDEMWRKSINLLQNRAIRFCAVKIWQSSLRKSYAVTPKFHGNYGPCCENLILIQKIKSSIINPLGGCLEQ